MLYVVPVQVPRLVGVRTASHTAESVAEAAFERAGPLVVDMHADLDLQFDCNGQCYDVKGEPVLPLRHVTLMNGLPLGLLLGAGADRAIPGEKGLVEAFARDELDPLTDRPEPALRMAPCTEGSGCGPSTIRTRSSAHESRSESVTPVKLAQVGRASGGSR